jgi:hypothetical protein
MVLHEAAVNWFTIAGARTPREEAEQARGVNGAASWQARNFSSGVHTQAAAPSLPCHSSGLRKNG